MFGKKKETLVQGGTTLLAKDCDITGSIEFAGNLEVEGRIEGNVQAKENSAGKVRILSSGKVTGDVRAPRIVINGEVEGDVFATEHIELAENAVVTGSVHYKVIEMMKGSEVNGSLVHINDADLDRPDNVSSFQKTDSQSESA